MDFKIISISVMSLFIAVSCSKSKEKLVPTTSSTQSSYELPYTPSGENPFDDSTSGGSLFDASVGGDAQPATAYTSTTTVPPVSEPTQQCFASDSGFGLGSAFNMDPYGSSSPACFDSQSSQSWNPWNENNFYEFGTWSYDAIRACSDIALGIAPATTATADQVKETFKRGKLALIRCFRLILKQQRQYSQWTPSVQQGLNYNDGMYYYMLNQTGQSGTSGY